ncbi:MAG: hypothetical protein RJA44_851 [Pseudomonadota bacterium]
MRQTSIGAAAGPPALIGRRLAGWAALLLVALLLGACGSTPRGSRVRSPAVPPVSAPRGASLDTDGPPAQPPPDLERTPDAVPRLEPIRSGGPNKPYAVAGRRYEPIIDERPYRERGLGSWYGRKYHGLPTASGEPYNMYAMTAAHPRLPIPSYARVSNPANGRSVVVRINDRGPFVSGYEIDLSYTAALRLGLLRGVAPVEVERITPEMIRRSDAPAAPARPEAPPPADADPIENWLLLHAPPGAGLPAEPCLSPDDC